MLAGKRVLITGGTGSFGSLFASRLKALGASSIRIFSRDEKKHWDMAHEHPEYEYMLGDVRDPMRLRHALNRIDVVVHAAALKQVPHCEAHPSESIQTNVLGAMNLCDAAAASPTVEQLVALSTDKAVQPVNVMGMTKALMERIVCGYSSREQGKLFSCVRYGNVIGSRGSVLPLFLSQLRAGQPLTITDPQMTRFLMSLDEAADLVLFALSHTAGGQIFVRRSPAATVGEMARSMIALAHRPSDYPVVSTGIRPGEKTHEVLLSEYELPVAQDLAPEYTAVTTADTSIVMSTGAAYTSENTLRVTGPALADVILRGLASAQLAKNGELLL